MVYLALYFGLGLCGQLASIKLSNNPTSKTAKQIFGSFHIAMSVYHGLVAFRLVRGKFRDFDTLRYLKEGCQIVYLMCFLVSVDFVLSSEYNIQRKRVLELVTTVNLFALQLFFIFTRIGYLNIKAGTINIYVTMVIIPFLLLLIEVKDVLLKFVDKSKSKSS